jgi:PTH1 family peptidyl-tRNA hydrolase
LVWVILVKCIPVIAITLDFDVSIISPAFILYDFLSENASIGELGGHNVLLAKPETFINLSGIAVDCLMDKYRISRNDLLVISDDMNLPLGKIRLRPSGGMGGHNGMRSIISALGGDDFMRIRVGIGHPREEIFGTDRDVIVNYVLSDFLPHEEEMVETIVTRVAEAIDCCLTKGIETAMNRFN